MNLLLFERADTCALIPRTDPRCVHLLEVLRRAPGDSFDAGVVDGPRGKGVLTHVTSEHVGLAFTWNESPPLLAPLRLIVGLPRPQTARKILQESTSLGVQDLHFVLTDRGEPSYAQSTLWTSGEWKRHLIAGAEQAFCTRLPNFNWGHTLSDLLPTLPTEGLRLALDNYEASVALPEILSGDPSCHDKPHTPVTLALGAERGWSVAERDLLRHNQFTLVHLGARVLRVETASVAAIAIVKAYCGWL